MAGEKSAAQCPGTAHGCVAPPSAAGMDTVHWSDGAGFAHRNPRGDLLADRLWRPLGGAHSVGNHFPAVSKRRSGTDADLFHTELWLCPFVAVHDPFDLFGVEPAADGIRSGSAGCSSAAWRFGAVAGVDPMEFAICWVFLPLVRWQGRGGSWVPPFIWSGNMSWRGC